MAVGIADCITEIWCFYLIQHISTILLPNSIYFLVEQLCELSFNIIFHRHKHFINVSVYLVLIGFYLLFYLFLYLKLRVF